jgi:hypothetical protein
MGINPSFPGLSPLEGRLRTRYSPVRHSSATEPNSVLLPFDLHVLSLPLAFILSQDQTLHSKVSYKIRRDCKDKNNLSGKTNPLLVFFSLKRDLFFWPNKGRYYNKFRPFCTAERSKRKTFLRSFTRMRSVFTRAGLEFLIFWNKLV